MCRVTFKRITSEESRIFANDEHVGDVYRQPDILHEGEHYYLVVLDEDWRGPLRVHQRHRIRAAAEERIRTHPLWG